MCGGSSLLGAKIRRPAIPWFETRRFAPLLTMRIAGNGLILRSAL